MTDHDSMSLTYSFNLDQTHLPTIIRELREEFPSAEGHVPGRRGCTRAPSPYLGARPARFDNICGIALGRPHREGQEHVS